VRNDDVHDAEDYACGEQDEFDGHTRLYNFSRVNVCCGSNTEVTALPRYFRFAPNIRHQLGVSALVPADYDQQITNCAVVPNPASGSADASIIECLSYGAVDRRPRGLYLAHDEQHVGGESVSNVLCRA